MTTNPVWQETLICGEQWVVIETLLSQKRRRESMPIRFMGASRLIRIAKTAEHALDKRNFPEHVRIGTTYTHQSQAERPDLPASASVTVCVVQLIRRERGWYVLTIGSRVVSNMTPSPFVTPRLTEAARDWITERNAQIASTSQQAFRARQRAA